MKILNVAIALLAGTCVANADVIIFENTNPNFRFRDFDSGQEWLGQPLDITQDAFSQPPDRSMGPTHAIHLYSWWCGSSSCGTGFDLGWRTNARVAKSTIGQAWLQHDPPEPQTAYAPQLFAPGQTIDASLNWSSPMFQWCDIQASNSNGAYTFVPNNSILTCGVRLVLPDGVHYGFVEFDYSMSAPFRFHPVRWGYETQPDVPLMIPTDPCAADLSGSSDPNDPAYGAPDGLLDAADFFYYLDQFAAANLGVADLTGSSDPNDAGYGVPDGLLDASDFFYYLDVFVAGCP